jgi:hypothetical protein
METENKGLVTEPTDTLAEFRAAVAAEDAAPKKGMSDAALAKLRAIKEQDRLDAILADRFKTALGCVVPTPENLRLLVVKTRLSTPTLEYTGVWIPTVDLAERMAFKLSWFIAAGYKLGREIDSVTLVNFFSGLTLSETRMTNKESADNWDMESAEKRFKSRINRGVVEADPEPENPAQPAKVRLCKAGKKCLWLKHRKAAPATGRSLYCTPICQKSDSARQKRVVKVAYGQDISTAA